VPEAAAGHAHEAFGEAFAAVRDRQAVDLRAGADRMYARSDRGADRLGRETFLEAGWRDQDAKRTERTMIGEVGFGAMHVSATSMAEVLARNDIRAIFEAGNFSDAA
jgi:hypothetical protein